MATLSKDFPLNLCIKMLTKPSSSVWSTSIVHRSAFPLISLSLSSFFAIHSCLAVDKDELRLFGWPCYYLSLSGESAILTAHRFVERSIVLRIGKRSVWRRDPSSQQRFGTGWNQERSSEVQRSRSIEGRIERGMSRERRMYSSIDPGSNNGYARVISHTKNSIWICLKTLGGISCATINLLPISIDVGIVSRTHVKRCDLCTIDQRNWSEYHTGGHGTSSSDDCVNNRGSPWMSFLSILVVVFRTMFAFLLFNAKCTQNKMFLLVICDFTKRDITDISPGRMRSRDRNHWTHAIARS